MKKILIVDDATTSRKVVKNVLGDLDVDFGEAKNGEEGIEQAKNGNFDIIVSDVNMPGMLGTEMIQKIREFDHCKETIIIMLTTEVDEELRDIGKQCGVKLWITKPFDKEKFVGVMKKLIES